MGLFPRKTKTEVAVDYLAGAVTAGVVKSGVKVVAGTAAALLGLTAASAAISNARQHNQ